MSQYDDGSGAFGSAEDDVYGSSYYSPPTTQKPQGTASSLPHTQALPTAVPSPLESIPAPEFVPAAALLDAGQCSVAPLLDTAAVGPHCSEARAQADLDSRPSLPRPPTSSPCVPQEEREEARETLESPASSNSAWCSPVQVLPNTLHADPAAAAPVAAVSPLNQGREEEAAEADAGVSTYQPDVEKAPLRSSPVSSALPPPRTDDGPDTPQRSSPFAKPQDSLPALNLFSSAERRSVTVTEHPLLPRSAVFTGPHGTPEKQQRPLFSSDLDSPTGAGEEMREYNAAEPFQRRGLLTALADAQVGARPLEPAPSVASAAVLLGGAKDGHDLLCAEGVGEAAVDRPRTHPSTSAHNYHGVTSGYTSESGTAAAVVAGVLAVAHPTPYPVTSTSSLSDWSSAPRLGFPAPSGQSAAHAEAETLARRDAEERKREDRWYRLCRGVSLLASATPESIVRLRSAAREHGIPHHLRAVMWLTLTGMALKVDENEYFCAKLLRRNGYVTGPNADAIAADVQRTFPGHPYFSERDVGIYKLTNVLHALCWRNPLLSYCQSFNFLAAFLLLVLDDEERVFWLLVHIFEQLLPNDFYGETLLGANVEQAVLERLVRQRLPRVAARFNAAGLQVHTLVANWMMSMFVNVLPPATSLRLWDYLFCRTVNPGERTPAHLEITLAILKYLDDKGALVGEDAGELLMALREQTACLFDAAAVIRIANTFSISADELHQLRREAKPAVVQHLKAREQARATEQERRLAQELQQARKAEAVAMPKEASRKE